MATPYVLQPGEGDTLKLADSVLTFKATDHETAGAYSIIEGVWNPSGFGPLPHIHTEQEESFYVLDGQFDFQIGEDKLRAGPGTFLVVPRGTLHAFAAVDQASRLMFMHSPPLVGFFYELEKLGRKERCNLPTFELPCANGAWRRPKPSSGAQFQYEL